MASTQQVMLAQKIAAAAGGNITVDLWQDFEMATVDAANLASRDHHATAVWTVITAWGSSATAQVDSYSTINGSAGTGSNGLDSDNNTQAGRIICDMGGSYPTTQSMGFCAKVTALNASTFTWLYMFGEGSGGLTDCIVAVKMKRDAGSTYTVELISNIGSSSTITLSINTPYWFTVLGVKNSTCKLRVYDLSTGAQVGSEVTVTGDNKNPFYHAFAGNSSSGTGRRYIDNFCVDQTTAAFPLGP